MASDPLSGNFGEVWKEVVEECRKILDDEADYELIVGFNSYDQMVDYLKTLGGSIPKAQRHACCIVLLPTFSDFTRLRLTSSSSLEGSISVQHAFWGLPSCWLK